MIILIYLIVSCVVLLIEPEANRIVGDVTKNCKLSVKIVIIVGSIIVVPICFIIGVIVGIYRRLNQPK